MKTQDILMELRKKHGLSQDEMAEKLFVTRQAVSRWETGATEPGTETLKLISKTFGVSINTLLGQPEQLYCQACGMLLADETMGREPDGGFNEKHCRWCWTDGKYVGANTLEEMIEVCVPHVQMPPDAARAFLRGHLTQLEHWRGAQ